MNAEELITKYLETSPRTPKRKSLAQKQGARKAGRTRSRKQYVERHGYLIYNYHGKKRLDT